MSLTKRVPSKSPTFTEFFWEVYRHPENYPQCYVDDYLVIPYVAKEFGIPGRPDFFGGTIYYIPQFNLSSSTVDHLRFTIGNVTSYMSEADFRNTTVTNSKDVIQLLGYISGATFDRCNFTYPSSKYPSNAFIGYGESRGLTFRDSIIVGATIRPLDEATVVNCQLTKIIFESLSNSCFINSFINNPIIADSENNQFNSSAFTGDIWFTTLNNNIASINDNWRNVTVYSADFAVFSMQQGNSNPPYFTDMIIANSIINIWPKLVTPKVTSYTSDEINCFLTAQGANLTNVTPPFIPDRCKTLPTPNAPDNNDHLAILLGVTGGMGSLLLLITMGYYIYKYLNNNRLQAGMFGRSEEASRTTGTDARISTPLLSKA